MCLMMTIVGAFSVNTVREWDVGKPDHPDEALDIEELKMKEKREQERKTRKERHHRSPTPEAEPPVRKARRKEEDAPAKLLDDLFRKTKTSPCIYWLPLTQEQVKCTAKSDYLN
ncbi:Inactive dipeptidyl peptidase 10 [Homalodisca vitripennis]|nr:Inactive dipeptidyl peptidase 10 [Homalodisca vitripennis]